MLAVEHHVADEFVELGPSRKGSPVDLHIMLVAADDDLGFSSQLDDELTDTRKACQAKSNQLNPKMQSKANFFRDDRATRPGEAMRGVGFNVGGRR